MANPKTQLLEALRATPDGITAFETTPIPDPPAASPPTTVDDAIIVNGVCAYYLMEVFRSFAGLTPVELLLRLGQHSSIGEGLLLTGLQFLAGQEGTGELLIAAPEDGATLAPGNLRMVVQGVNTPLKTVSGSLNDAPVSFEPPADAQGDSNTWVGYADVTAGSYTLTVTATQPAAMAGADGPPLEATAAFTVAEAAGEDVEPAEGQDAPSVESAEQTLEQAVQNFYETVAIDSPAAVVTAARDNVQAALDVFKRLSASVDNPTVTQMLDGAQEALDVASDVAGMTGEMARDTLHNAIGSAASLARKASAALKELFS